jgi:hypothetical protein
MVDPLIQFQNPGNWDNNKRMLWLEKIQIIHHPKKNGLGNKLSNSIKFSELAYWNATMMQPFQRVVWNGQEQYLRFYHVMMEDSIRVALLAMHQSMNHAELDARKSAECPRNVFDLAAELYNDDNLDLVTNKYPMLHKDFEDHIFLFGSTAINVTPQKLKEKWKDVRGKLSIIKNNYDQSGNGAGDCHGNDPDHGPVEELTLTNNTDRKNFLGGNKPHLLYLWQILEDNALLDSTLMIIPDEIAASSLGCSGNSGFYDTTTKKSQT